ncbi:hypothetical protein C7S15_4133 [Burkholderia cepacia]|nr:hypothetical protein [Burkholderia cepacia]
MPATGSASAGRTRRHDIRQTNRANQTIRHASGPLGREDAGWDIGFR